MPYGTLFMSSVFILILTIGRTMGQRCECDRNGTFLNCRGLGLVQIPDHTQVIGSSFNKTIISHIYMDYNRFLNMTNILSQFPNLEYLNLTNNNITLQPVDKVMAIIELEVLDLSYNNIGNTIEHGFSKLRKLKALFLVSNEIMYLSKVTFWGLNMLSVLNLAHNSLKTFHTDYFPLQSLSYLILSFNQISTCTFSEDTVWLDKFLFIDLRHNFIYLPGGISLSPGIRGAISLLDNPVFCGCSILEFSQMLKHHYAIEWECQSPRSMAGIPSGVNCEYVYESSLRAEKPERCKTPDGHGDNASLSYQYGILTNCLDVSFIKRYQDIILVCPALDTTGTQFNMTFLKSGSQNDNLLAVRITGVEMCSPFRLFGHNNSVQIVPKGEILNLFIPSFLPERVDSENAEVLCISITTGVAAFLLLSCVITCFLYKLHIWQQRRNNVIIGNNTVVYLREGSASLDSQRIPSEIPEPCYEDIEFSGRPAGMLVNRIQDNTLSRSTSHQLLTQPQVVEAQMNAGVHPDRHLSTFTF